MKNSTFWDVMPCASIFSVEVKLKLPSQQRVISSGMWSHVPLTLGQNWCSRSLQNIGNHLHEYDGAIIQKNTIQIFTATKISYYSPCLKERDEGDFTSIAFHKYWPWIKKTMRSTLLGDISTRSKCEIQSRISIRFFYFSHVTGLRN